MKFLNSMTLTAMQEGETVTFFKEYKNINFPDKLYSKKKYYLEKP